MINEHLNQCIPALNYKINQEEKRALALEEKIFSLKKELDVAEAKVILLQKNDTLR